MCGCSKKRKDKKFNRRGQFTLFIIVGLVIFAVFAFALYARAKIITAQINTQGEKQIKEYIDRNSIAQYVTGCLEAVSEDVIVRAMLQGGTFNFTGQTKNVDYIEFYDPTYNQTLNISIVVKPNLACPYGGQQSEFIVYPSPTPTGLPDYPYTCGYVAVNNLPNLYRSIGTGPCKNNCKRDFSSYSGFFGINNLKKLCDMSGANRPLDEIQYVPNYTTNNYLTCDYYSIYDKSMQKYIEEEINSGIMKCLNFTEILKRSPSNITVNDSPVSEITFRNNGFNIKVYYPFTITMRNRQPITKLMDFSIEKDIPFKELYEYTYELLNYDVKMAEFDIVENRTNVLSQGNRRPNSNVYTSKYVVQLIRGNESTDFVDIVRIIDEEHKLRGLPLVINMGFINRRPVLDYIHMSASQLFDIMAVENDTLDINPAGYDPDNDYLKYEYGFWREDYVDTYNTSDPKCEHPENIHYVIENCTKIDVTADPPNNWTNSSIYKTTQKNATYKIAAEDAGFHKVRVTVRDVMHNLEDYQIVRILVFDLPKAEIKGDNFYDDVEDNYASYEDLYVLNGSESQVSVMASALGYGFSSFYWLDQREPFDKNIPIFGDLDKVLFFPNATTILDSGASILNITDYIFRNRSETSILHNISLTVTMQTIGLSNTAYYGVNVTQCLNHSNENNPPYPYNKGDAYGTPDDLMNILQADHRCCTDGMTYELNTTECYNKAMYGMNKNFPDYTSVIDWRSPVTTSPYPIMYDVTNVDNRPYDNDVFKQNFTRYCSGDRGNICTGDGEETRIVFKECNDDNYETPNVERCSGPADLEHVSESEMECTTYEGYTFEYLMHAAYPEKYPDATGYCTGNQREFSNGYTFRDGGYGKYVCFGMCDSDGECIPTECRCSYDNYLRTGNNDYLVDIECDGRTKSSTQRDSCIRNKYREDRCDNCELKESSVCKYTADGTCQASEICNGQTAGSTLQKCDNTGSKGIIDICNNDCQVIDASTSCTPHSPTNGCSTTPGCNYKSPYGSANSVNAYCDDDCIEQNCGNYKIIGLGYPGVHCAPSCVASDNLPSTGTPNRNINCVTGKVCCSIGGARCDNAGVGCTSP